MRFSGLRWMLALAIVGLEFLWAYPWVLLLSGVFYGSSAAPLLSASASLVLLALGAFVVRAALARNWSLRAARVAVVASGVASGMTVIKLLYYPDAGVLDLWWIGALLRSAHDTLPAVPPSVMGALLAAGLWWRGVVLGEREVGSFEVDRAFRRGIGWSVAFVVLLVVYGDTRAFALTQPAPAYLLAFFAIGLVALAVTRLLSLWEQTQPDPALALASNRPWLMLLVGVVGLIFSAAAALATAVHVPARAAVLALLRPLAPVVAFAFYVLFAVALVVARVLIFILSQLRFRHPGIAAPTAPPPSLRTLLQSLPPGVISDARWGMVLLVVAVLVVLVAISVVRSRRKARTVTDDERESIWSGRAVAAGWAEAWRRFWRRRPAASGDHDLPAVGTIRAIYRELLQLGAAAGAPRAPHHTPYEHHPVLATTAPMAREAIGALTEVYVKARYSAQLLDPAEIAAAQAALARVKAALAA